MTVTAPSIASLVQFNPGQLGTGVIGAAAPTGAGQFPLPPDGKPPSFDLAANGSGALIGFQQGGYCQGARAWCRPWFCGPAVPAGCS